MKGKLVNGRDIPNFREIFNLLTDEKIYLIQSLTLESEDDGSQFHVLLNALKTKQNLKNLLTGVEQITITENDIFKGYNIDLLKGAIIKSGLKNIDLIQNVQDSKTKEIFEGVIKNNQNIENRSIDYEDLFVSTLPIFENKKETGTKIILKDKKQYSDFRYITRDLCKEVEIIDVSDGEITSEDIIFLMDTYKENNIKKIIINNSDLSDFYLVSDNHKFKNLKELEINNTKIPYETLNKIINNSINIEKITIDYVEYKKNYFIDNNICNTISYSNNDREIKIKEKMEEVKILYNKIKKTSATIDASVTHKLTLIDNSKKLLTASVTEEKTKVYKEFIQDRNISYQQKAVMILSSLGLESTNEEPLPETLNYNWKNNAKIDIALTNTIDDVLAEYRAEQKNRNTFTKTSGF